MGRPLVKYGSRGSSVALVQRCLEARPVDSIFGSVTEEAVEMFQLDQQLGADGVVGDNTWAALEREFDLAPYPPQIPPLPDDETVAEILSVAEESAVARYQWRDRGLAPDGYIPGMAMAYATVYRKLLHRDPVVYEMARANTGDSAHDALAWYDTIFATYGMSNDTAGVDTLRHLFVLLTGLGMRESSGQHCEGRDQSASNVSSDTAEAGLFQMSWNASNGTTDMAVLFDTWASGLSSDPPACALAVFKEGVSCSSSDWQNYGSGKGASYQKLAKSCPQFAVETAAVGLRVLRQHWGPINRHEAEVLEETDELFQSIEPLIIPPESV